MDYDPQPGMLVVCIASASSEERKFFQDVAFPSKGKVYTIREVDCGILRAEPVIHLREIVNPTNFYHVGGLTIFTEIWFLASCFRPVRDDALDVFRETLKQAPAPRKEVLV